MSDVQSIPMQLNDIEIRAQMVRAIIPNFNHLKKSLEAIDK